MFLEAYTCGGPEGLVIEGQLIDIVSTVIFIIQVVVPIFLVIFGMLDLGKAVMAQKEDEIKKGQQTFMKRVVAAILVFFVVMITKLVVNLVASSSDEDGLMNCINCFIEGTEDGSETGDCQISS